MARRYVPGVARLLLVEDDARISEPLRAALTGEGFAVDAVTTGEDASAHHQRSDVCAVPASGVVAEAMVALVLADAVLEKFGGDSVAETKRNLDAYLASIPETLRSRRTESAETTPVP